MAVVRVVEPFAYQHLGVQIVIGPDRFFDETDPIVTGNPRAGWEPVGVSPAPYMSTGQVEQASAAPGEQRNARRPR